MSANESWAIPVQRGDPTRTLPESLRLISSPLQNDPHRANQELIEFATGPMFLSRR